MLFTGEGGKDCFQLVQYVERKAGMADKKFVSSSLSIALTGHNPSKLLIQLTHINSPVEPHHLVPRH